MSEFRSLVNHLRARLQPAYIPFVIGGSFALAARGFPRFTDDIDLMVLVDDVERVAAALSGSRYHRESEVNFRDDTTGLYIDVLPVRDEAQLWAFDTATFARVMGAEGVRVLSPEGCCVMLLREATLGSREKRPQRLVDIGLLAGAHDLHWPTIAHWAERMGYEAAYEDVQAEQKVPLSGRRSA